MFDVYLNRRGDLLVLPNGLPIPNKETGRWRKKKTRVAAVSDEIRLAIQRWGYYRRKLGERFPPTTGSQHEVKCDLETAPAALSLR